VASIVVLGTDGSELSRRALAAGLAVLGPADRTIVATVTETVDPTLLAGVSGFGGGVMSAEQYDEEAGARAEAAATALREAVDALGLHDAETTVLQGDPAEALCDFATEVKASVLVIGSHGRGGIKRALLGSVSDHVVRNAPCPVVVARAD
jgi:nucleotide-binding universal stress UspA family protein